MWSYGSWIYDYLCNNFLPLKLWVWILFRQGVLDTTLFDKVCQRLATGLWFSPGSLVSSTNKTDRHDITEILLKVVLNTITNPIPQIYTLPKFHKLVALNCMLHYQHQYNSKSRRTLKMSRTKTVIPVFRGHFSDKEKVFFLWWPFNTVDCLIEVITLACLTIDSNAMQLIGLMSLLLA